MSEYSSYLDRIATMQIEERVARRRADALPRQRRPRGRHALAHRLHHLADRIDG